MAQRKIAYSELCILGNNGLYLSRSAAGEWKLDEVALNMLLCAMANSGADSQRIMPYGVWDPHPNGIADQFAPYVLVEAPILLPAGGPADAQLGTAWKFDLRQFNDFYFPILRRLVQIARSYEIKTWFCLGDSCQFHDFKGSKKYSPWVTNVNGLTTLWEEAAHPFFKAWIERLLLELAGLGVGWSLGNEMNVPHFRELAKEIIFPFFKSGAFTPENATFGATMEVGDFDPASGAYSGGAGTQDDIKKDFGEAFGEEAKKAVWREVHGVGDGDYPAKPNPEDCALFWWHHPPHKIKIWLSDDGSKKADSPCDRNALGHVRPSAARWKRIVETALTFENHFVFEHLPKGGGIACQQNTMKMIYRTIHGQEPEEKWHYEPPAPPPVLIKRKICASSSLTPGPYCPVVIEISVPEGSPAPPLCTEHGAPPEPASCYQRFIAGRPIWKWQLGAFLRCLFGG